MFLDCSLNNVKILMTINNRLLWQ